MTTWKQQFESLIRPCVEHSKVTREVVVEDGAIARTGPLLAGITDSRKALVMADEAGFGAAGAPVVASLEAAGFEVRMIVKPVDPLPVASVESAEEFRQALAADPELFPVSVGSGVINDLVKFAAFDTDRRYVTVATAASMDGYTSAGAPLARGGFKVTIPTRAPIAMIADLAILSDAPAEMNAWGYADLAGKVPAGGDWILADLVGAEPIDHDAWTLVQDHVRPWLDSPEGIANGDGDALANLFIGLTAVGFAMEIHGTSRPASGADHQVAHIWEMHGLKHQGRKVAHGEAVAVGAVAALALYDWLIEQELGNIDPARVAAMTPDLSQREAMLKVAIIDPQIAEKALGELRSKHVEGRLLEERLVRIRDGWAETRDRLRDHMVRLDTMTGMLSRAGAPADPSDIGLTSDRFMETVRAAGYIRRRYTIFDFLHETGLDEAAFEALRQRLAPGARPASAS